MIGGRATSRDDQFADHAVPGVLAAGQIYEKILEVSDEVFERVSLSPVIGILFQVAQPGVALLPEAVLDRLNSAPPCDCARERIVSESDQAAQPAFSRRRLFESPGQRTRRCVAEAKARGQAPVASSDLGHHRAGVISRRNIPVPAAVAIKIPPVTNVMTKPPNSLRTRGDRTASPRSVSPNACPTLMPIDPATMWMLETFVLEQPARRRP